MRAGRSFTRYAALYGGSLALAHLLAVGAAVAILIPLNRRTSGAAHTYLTANLITAAVLAVLGAVAIAVAGALNIVPTLRWFVPGRQPDPRQRRAAMKLVRRQSTILAATWLACGAILIGLNVRSGIEMVVPIALGVLFGATAAVSTAILLAQRLIRPILLAAARGSEGGVTAPGVLTRLMVMWLLCSALPCGVIVALIFIRSTGWIIPETASVEILVVVVSLAAVLVGLPAMILTSRSISDPIHEVIEAMAEVEHGRIGTGVGVYERSEIGRLQKGFNRMVAGLAERDRLRDLFGRHVGADVARRALEEGASLSGDVQDAAVLFIDLVGSTQLAASRSPHQVAEVLNDFFRIVVNNVDQRQGLINKFQGDAALAVFGAPLPISNPASAALTTARALSSQLRRLPVADFGIGVSAGPVFAGNIGAENRYEYTVIGDPVNEAARLADLAKTSDERVVCSAAAIERADSAERRLWSSRGCTVLRGRAEVTDIFAPAPRP